MIIDVLHINHIWSDDPDYISIFCTNVDIFTILYHHTTAVAKDILLRLRKDHNLLIVRGDGKIWAVLESKHAIYFRDHGYDPYQRNHSYTSVSYKKKRR